MTRKRFNQEKDQSTSKYKITLSKAHKFFLEDIDNVDMKDIYKITNKHPTVDEKGVVNKEYCDSNLLSSSIKILILSKNITKLKS